MLNKWEQVWNQKQLEPTPDLSLEQLLEADGFSSQFGGLKESGAWLEYVERLANQLEISQDDSIFEVGCGAGAFLYRFYQKGNNVGGIDYSANLAKIALSVMPKADISVGEAIDIPVTNQFDIVVSNGVFLYFPTYEYAASVLQRMVQMATKSIGIFDVPDLSKQDEALTVRKAKLGEAEYQEMYQGLDHLYYSKEWFQQELANEPVQVRIEDQNIRGYGNNEYRFNVLIHK